MSWVQDFGWKKKAERLRMMILAGAPLFEIDPLMLRTLETMRKGLRGQSSRDEFEQTLGELNTSPPSAGSSFLWEPIDIYGWAVSATMYLLDGKPWWLVRATHKKPQPSDKEITMVEKVVGHLGADPVRDRIMNTSFDAHGYGMWWTWINQTQLYEFQTDRQTKDFRVVPEGTPVPVGWERVDRNKVREPKL